MNFEILVGGEVFKSRLIDEIANASDRVWIQAMTFECDGAGNAVIEAIDSSPVSEKNFIVDDYSYWVINDSFVFSTRYLKDRDFRLEVNKTRKWLNAAGGSLKFRTNRVGVLMHKYPFRNHKKQVVVDDIVFLGGVNFSDHNLAWYDMMVRIESPELAEMLVGDMGKTTLGENQSEKVGVGGLGDLYFLDGIKSKYLYEQIFEEIRGAEKQIEIISPYVSDPLLRVLEEKSDIVSIYTPSENNKSAIKSMMLSRAYQSGFSVFEDEIGMSHMKAILIDGNKLIFGSSNFDFVSYYCEQEVVVVSDNYHLVSEFKVKVMDPVKERSYKYDFEQHPVKSTSFLLNIAPYFLKYYAKLF